MGGHDSGERHPRSLTPSSSCTPWGDRRHNVVPTKSVRFFARTGSRIGVIQKSPAWQPQHQGAKVRRTGDIAHREASSRMEAARTTGTLVRRLAPLEPEPDHRCEIR